MRASIGTDGLPRNHSLIVDRIRNRGGASGQQSQVIYRTVVINKRTAAGTPYNRSGRIDAKRQGILLPWQHADVDHLISVSLGSQ